VKEQAHIDSSRKNLIFWLIVSLCIAPVILSTLSYYFFRPSSTVNYGLLLESPVNAREIPIFEVQRPSIESAFGEELEMTGTPSGLTFLKNFKGRWLLARFGGDICDERCENELYVMRQVRLMTGKNRHRVERIWFSSEETELAKRNMSEKYAGTWKVGIEDGRSEFYKSLSSSLPENLQSKKNNLDGIWLVDPRGAFMMKFPISPDIRKVYKDLSRLLKVSRVG
tara:strand:- start:13254 stop:13928 length:675 start_codon:yes stop_codon:yes gene_type:complete